MPESGGYGHGLGNRIFSETAPVFFRQTLKKSLVAVTRIRCDAPTGRISEPAPVEDAYQIALQLRDFPSLDSWVDGRAIPRTNLRTGNTTFYDLRRRSTFHISEPFQSIHFYFPKLALDAICDDAEVARIGDLAITPCVGIDDAVLRHLTLATAPAFDHPGQANRLFMEHVTLAVGAHVVRTYGGAVFRPARSRGGLAPWQEKRAKEILSTEIHGETPLAVLATECGLSVGHFSRAFRQSTGTSPHRWLLQHRIDRAMDYLHGAELSLNDIALACGFADQSHFTRVFARLVGISPGAWRRSTRS